MNDILAIITLDQKRRKTEIVITQKQFKFGCIRCADLCCKLGGPKLTQNDVERIEKAGYNTKDFLGLKRGIDNTLKNIIGSLKTKQDGSCIFLQYNSKIKCSRCSIYDFRPTLCRIYPFRIENLKSSQIAFKFIPCCKGLNNQKGKIVDRDFFLEKIEEAKKVFKTKS